MAHSIDSGIAARPDDSPENALGEAAGTSDEDILTQARSRIKMAEEATADERRLALEDLEFRSGDQWPAHIRRERETDSRPCLTINRLPQFVQQVTNDQRQNRPAIKVHAVSDGANQDTAEKIQGLVRHIEYNSNADVAYDTAFEAAAGGGFGYFRIIPGYANPESFDQELFIKRIRNQFSVTLDPYAQEPDGSDAEWGAISDFLSPEEYKARFPKSELAVRDSDWQAIGDQRPGWMKDGSARVTEYFYKEMKQVEIYLLATGETVRAENLEARQMAAMQAGLDARVVRSRTAQIPTVKWCTLNGVEILDRTELPIQWIPIIPVYGQELYINGKRILESLIRHAKDPQKMYNFWASAETEAVALAPKAPYIGAEGQFEGHEPEWETANRRNHAYLEYKQTDVAGRPAPPPQRQSVDVNTQAITQGRMMSSDDLKSTVGYYDASIGNQSNEVAGVAIQRRASQSQTGSFHFIDNLTRSMRHAGRILVDWIPYIYDAPRTIRIIGDDGTQSATRINEEHKDESGKPVLYDLTTGTYGVTVDTGPSFQTKRQEAAASMIEFTRAVPQVAAACADIIVKNLDFPGSQELSDRIKKTLPPQLQDDPKTKDIPPQIIAQMQHMGQMIDGLTKNLNECTKVIETKQLELEHRERVEVLKIKTDAEVQMMKAGSVESIALLKAQLTEMEHRLSFLKMNQPIEGDSDFNPEGADGGNYAGIGHIGGTENLTGGASPGQSVEGNP